MEIDGKVRVLLVEDHGLVREGVRLILERESGIEVVGEAADGTDALRLFKRLSDDPAGGIDLVITDLSLPGIDGLELTRQIKALRPATWVLLLTMHNDEEHIRGMLDTGADGYLLKQSAAIELTAAIRVVLRGETVLSPQIARWLTTQFRHQREHQVDQLSEREQGVLHLLAEGATSKEIATRLHLSSKTVENHRARILDKLGVSNTVAAITVAHQRGLIKTNNAG